MPFDDELSAASELPQMDAAQNQTQLKAVRMPLLEPEREFRPLSNI